MQKLRAVHRFECPRKSLAVSFMRPAVDLAGHVMRRLARGLLDYSARQIDGVALIVVDRTMGENVNDALEVVLDAPHGLKSRTDGEVSALAPNGRGKQ